MTRAAILLLALALPGAAAAELAPQASVETGRPAALRDVGYDQRVGAQLPLDLALRDEEGRTVTLGQYFGQKPVVLVPAYYECPMLCSLVLGGLTSALRALAFDAGREFSVVVFSINPADTSAMAAAKKATYVADYRRPGASAGWHFLTGDEASIQALTRAIGFRYAWDAASKQYAHASGIVVATPDGVVARYFFGVEFPPRDLRLALVEASAGRVGSVIDQVLLFCFHWDATTGRYSGLAISVMQVAGAVTLLALGTFVALSLRREARG